jgi:hypothetical protein
VRFMVETSEGKDRFGKDRVGRIWSNEIEILEKGKSEKSPNQ